MQFIEGKALSTDELETLAQSQGRIWYADEEDTIEIPPPAQQQLRTALAEYSTTHTPRPAFVCELPDCQLAAQAAALYRGERLLLDTTRNHFSSRYIGSYPQMLTHALKSRIAMGPNRAEECLFSLVCMDPSYYHWLLEFLPKLRLLERYQSETGRTPTLVVKPDPPNFVTQTLALAGYGPNQWIEWDQRSRAVKRLVIALHRPHRFDYEDPADSEYRPSRTDFVWLRNRMRSQIPSESVDTDANRRIYVSRQQADRGRKLVNDKKVLTTLRERGFESHILEEYSFRQQVRLFIEADVIVGPHGAGLANMLFADDPLVVELFPKTVLKPHFYFLANIMEFDYEAIVTDAIGNNLYVDIEQLERRLDNIKYYL